MSSRNRRYSFSSSAAAASSTAKRPAAAESAAKAPAAAQQAKKRVALGNLTNKCNPERNPARPSGAKETNVKVARSTSTVRKGPGTCIRDPGLHQNPLITSSDLKPTTTTIRKDTLRPISDGPTQTVGTRFAPCSTVLSSDCSGDSASLVETMSTSDSMKSPDFEYIDNGDSSALASLERRATNNLYISVHADETGCTWKKDVSVATEAVDCIFDVDNNQSDPQLCAALACDIYKHLWTAETQKRPSMDYMERVQKDINSSMRAILIDWLVEVAEEYRLVPDTLYLTVNYIDRYLSGNEMSRQRLQLLGVACMMIAAKYEEICAPQVEEFCFITDNTYFKDEVLQMEAAVLKYLKFEMTAPTPKCFLRRFVHVAQGCDEVPSLQFEFLANYVAELSLLEYHLLFYRPSLIAAASIFLSRFILQPRRQPWNGTLAHYTLYKPSELFQCVKALQDLFCNGPSSSLPAIREKYSQHKYKFVAKKYCPPSIPSEFFQDPSN